MNKNEKEKGQIFSNFFEKLIPFIVLHWINNGIMPPYSYTEIVRHMFANGNTLKYDDLEYPWELKVSDDSLSSELVVSKNYNFTAFDIMVPILYHHLRIFKGGILRGTDKEIALTFNNKENSFVGKFALNLTTKEDCSHLPLVPVAIHEDSTQSIRVYFDLHKGGFVQIIDKGETVPQYAYFPSPDYIHLIDDKVRVDVMLWGTQQISIVINYLNKGIFNLDQGDES